MVIDLKTALITARVITAQHWFKSMWISDINLFSPIYSTKLMLLWRGPYGAAKLQNGRRSKQVYPHFPKENVLGSFATLRYEKASNEVAQ